MARRPNDVVSDVIEKHRVRNNRVFERQWMICLAFYVGNQYVAWNRVTNRLTPIPQPRPHQVRLVSNKILPAVQMAVGKLMKTMPKAEVIPPDGDEKKVNIAKVATQVLEYRNRKTEYESKLQKMAMWAAIAGTAFLKQTWDPSLGEDIEIDGKPMREGDEMTTVCSPFEIAVDPLAQDVESAKWMMHYRLQTPEYCKEMWNVDVEATESTAQDMFGLMDMRLAGDMVGGGVYMPPKGVLVREYWERPSDEYPEGRLIIVAGDKLAYSGPNYMKELPFVRMTWFDVPNSFWAKGLVEDALGLQKNYNRRRSQVAENANLMGNPMWVAPLGSFPKGKEPTNAPGQIVEYNPNAAGPEPKMETPPPLPPQVYQDMDKSEQEISDVTGVRQIGPGMLPQGVRAAAALALVNEMDQTLITPVVRNFEACIRQSARMRINIIRMFYDNPREIHIVGGNRSFAVAQFKGSDLDGEFDINIQSVSGLPQDKTARAQLLQQFMQMGLIDQMTFLKLMELSDVDEVFEDMQADLNAAQWENDKLKKGKEQTAASYENHKMHIYEHTKFMRTLEFKKLPDNVKHLFIQHVQDHEVLMQQQSQSVNPNPGADPMAQQQQAQQAQSMQQDPAMGMMPGVVNSGIQAGMTNVNHQLMSMQG